MNNQSHQRNLLDQTKTVTEALYSLMSAAKEAGGNVKVIFIAINSCTDILVELLQANNCCNCNFNCART